MWVKPEIMCSDLFLIQVLQLCCRIFLKTEDFGFWCGVGWSNFNIASLRYLQAVCFHCCPRCVLFSVIYHNFPDFSDRFMRSFVCVVRVTCKSGSTGCSMSCMSVRVCNMLTIHVPCLYVKLMLLAWRAQLMCRLAARERSDSDYALWIFNFLFHFSRCKNMLHRICTAARMIYGTHQRMVFKLN